MLNSDVQDVNYFFANYLPSVHSKMCICYIIKQVLSCLAGIVIKQNVYKVAWGQLFCFVLTL